MSRRKTKKPSAPRPMSLGAEKERNKISNHEKDAKNENRNVDLKKQNKFSEKEVKCYKIIFWIALVIATITFAGYYIYANESHHLSLFLSFWSSAIFEIVLGVLGDVVVTFLATFVFKKHAGWTFAIGLICVWFFLSISGILEVGAVNVEEKENKQAQVTEAELKNMTDDGYSDKEEVYVKLPYNFENDPFFTVKEEYFGATKGSLLDDEIIQCMVEIILNDMKAQARESKSVPEIYVQYTQAAELQYQTYLFQRERDWNKEDSYSENYAKEKRLEDLSSALDLSICADEEYKDPENRRGIAIHYKDLADEYLKDGDQQNGADMLEESAKWAMKSIYTAFSNNNYPKMKQAYESLDIAVETFSGLKDIGDTRKSNLIQCREAYKLIVDKCLGEE